MCDAYCLANRMINSKINNKMFHLTIQKQIYTDEI